MNCGIIKLDFSDEQADLSSKSSVLLCPEFKLDRLNSSLNQTLYTS